MKNVNKMFWSLLLSMIILIGIAACDPDDEIIAADESGYLGNLIIVENEQVWSPNYETGKLSNIFDIFTGDRNISANVFLPQNAQDEIQKQVSLGSISNGILNIDIDALGDDLLLETGNDLLYYIFRDWWGNNNKETKSESIKINPESVRGNIITIMTDTNPPEGLIREGFYGSQTALSAEYIYLIYVNHNCTITAAQSQDIIGYTTYKEFNLNLKKGWNAICKKETYTTTGYATISMEIKNPSDFKWILLPTPYITIKM